MFDADQSHIWFTVQSGNFVGRLTLLDRSVDLVPVPTEAARPHGIKVAPDGTPWIALLGTNKHLIAFFDCLHDLADPAGAARHA